MSPGYPCCCENCEIFADDFNREDGTDIGDEWSEEAGSWSISGNALAAGSANGVAIAQTEPSGYPYVVQASIAMDQNDYARIVFAYEDSDNYWYAELRKSVSVYAKMHLYQRSGGSDTLKASSFNVSPGAWSATGLRVCVHSTFVYVTLWLSGSLSHGLRYNGFSSAHLGAGVGTGGTATSVTFDNFSIQRHEDAKAECPSCASCSECDSGNPGEQYQVTLSGIAAGGECPCTSLNGTYVLDQVANCEWRYSEMISCEDDPTVEFSIVFKLGPNHYVNSFVHADISVAACLLASPGSDTCSFNLYWKDDLEEIDCEPSNQEIPLASTGGDARGCDFSAATCSVSAV